MTFIHDERFPALFHFLVVVALIVSFCLIPAAPTFAGSALSQETSPTASHQSPPITARSSLSPSIIEAIARVLDALAWPLVALFALCFFREDLRRLLQRLRRGGGVEFDPPPQSEKAPRDLLGLDDQGATRTEEVEGPPPRPSDIPIPQTPFTLEMRQMISNLPQVQNESDLERRNEVLLLVAARAVVVFQFEQVDGVIWGSQLELLNHLNSRPQGETLKIVKDLFYERAASLYQSLYEELPFERYLGFLQSHNLIQQLGDVVSLTQKGSEYLIWRVDQRKPPKSFG